MGEGNCPGEPGLEAVGTNLPQPLQLLCLHLQGMAVVLGMPQKALGCPKTSPMQRQRWASHGATGACHPAPFARTKSGIAQAPPQPCPAPSRRRRARSWRCRCGQLFRRKRGNGWDRVVIATAGSSWAKQRGTAPLQPLQQEPGALQEPQHPAGWEQGILASPGAAHCPASPAGDAASIHVLVCLHGSVLCRLGHIGATNVPSNSRDQLGNSP